MAGGEGGAPGDWGIEVGGWGGAVIGGQKTAPFGAAWVLAVGDYLAAAAALANLARADLRREAVLAFRRFFLTALSYSD